MKNELLEKTRKITNMVKNAPNSTISFKDLCETLSKLLHANTYIMSSKGKILGLELLDEKDSCAILDEKTGEKKLPKEYVQSIMDIEDTLENITQDKILEIFKYDINSYNKYITIIPIIVGSKRVGTFLFSRYENKFTEKDLILGEYSATVVGMEIMKGKWEENKEKMRKRNVVKVAIETLSYSELDATGYVFEALGANEGSLVGSKIALKVGITKSSIVNALRKLECAGVIESKSLGVKGTYIRILNDVFLEELEKYKHA